MQLLRWDNVALEQLKPGIGRQVIHSERMSIARIHLSAGAVVPRHAHDNEQVTMLESGRLVFHYDDGERELAPGDVIVTPPNAPHEVHALEDSVALDLFAPAREDWIRGEDTYLRS